MQHQQDLSDLKECDENFDICDDHYGTCNDIGKGNYKCSCIHGTYQSENIKVDGTDCSVAPIKVGLTVGLGIVCGIAVACFIPAYLWFIISPAFGKAEYNTAAAAEVGSTEDEDEDDEEERDHKDDLKRDLEEDEELDKQLIFHQTMIQNMSNFNPMPRVNRDSQSYGVPNSIELSTANSMDNFNYQQSN
ncbi:hypothetical protein BSL78_24937 [Apostichopus japonicus]|uniref:EGF-like domain-containing protein n=1 Tax=Stichopus japonicus TaxID=307972 RepID=A0A2G8JR27_STIJA|nr:hypothetical protein BSL78_24937 [Apostichopus japonicus]